MEKILKIQNLNKSYNNRVILSDINLEVYENDYVSIIGESGGGKSTLLNIIGLLERFDTGSYSFFGTWIDDKLDTECLRYNRVGYIFQNYNLIEKLNVHDNIFLPAIYSNLSINENRLYSLAEELKIMHLLENRAADLSGGEKQRVAIARALLMDPPLILADEPTGNLDSDNARIVFETFDKLYKEGKTIIVVTHDVDKANLALKKYNIVEGGLCRYG